VSSSIVDYRRARNSSDRDSEVLAMRYPRDWIDLPPAPDFPDAACRSPEVDAKWFFPTRGDHNVRFYAKLARQVCATCPHQTACADDALAAGDMLSGIWGGTSTRQRKRLRREGLR
jgi:hypothetical protein